MNLKKIELLSQLRDDLMRFIDELIVILPGNGHLVIMKSFVKIVIIEDVASYIVRNILPLEDKVKARDEQYFIENAIMFETLQDRASTVNHFRDLWIQTDDDYNKNIVWQWLEHFIESAKNIQALA